MSRMICVIAGEASSDELGAELIGALRNQIAGDVQFCGIGGPKMAERGANSPISIDKLAIVGIFEGLKHYRKIVELSDQAAEFIAQQQPDIAIFIDSWGFTQRVTDRLGARKVTFPLVKYVGPQIWATRAGRARKIAQNYDLLLSINAMDLPYYEGLDLEVEFVGNPIVTRNEKIWSRAAARDALGFDREHLLLCIAPGSRSSEIAYLEPIFRQTVKNLTKLYPGNLEVLVPLADASKTEMGMRLANWPIRVTQLDESKKQQAFAASDVALAASGTVTTQIALAQTPVVVAYRFHPLTYRIIKLIATADYASLMNLAVGTMVAPEFIQGECRPENLTEAVDFLLRNAQARSVQLRSQNAALNVMGRGERPTALRAARILAQKIAATG